MTYLVDIRIDNKAMFAWAKSIGIAQADLGYVVHSLLCAAHGELRLRPFRAHPNGETTRVLGYTTVDANTLQFERQAVAEPMVSSAILSEASKGMPENWVVGSKYSFSTLVVPICQIPRTRKQVDVFLRAPEGSDRSQVYVDWLSAKMKEAGDVSNASVKMFRLDQVRRRGHTDGDTRRKLGSKFTIPVVEIEGEIIVNNGEAFGRMISGAVGRHAAFGMGAVFLRPAKG